jgi:hypothetical protein
MGCRPGQAMAAMPYQGGHVRPNMGGGMRPMKAVHPGRSAAKSAKPREQVKGTYYGQYERYIRYLESRKDSRNGYDKEFNVGGEQEVSYFDRRKPIDEQRVALNKRGRRAR